MGHEFLGVIDVLGSEVSELKRGDLVVAPFACSDVRWSWASPSSTPPRSTAHT